MPKPKNNKNRREKRGRHANRRTLSNNVNLMTRPDVIPLVIRPRTYLITRAYEYGALSVNTTVPINVALTFALSNMPSFSDFTALFDAFRIIQATVSFMPYQTVCNSVASFPGYLHSVIDYDDSTPLSSVTQAEQYDTYKKNSLLTSFTRVLHPAVSSAEYLTITTTGYSVANRGFKGPWIDSVSNAIPYFGIKMISDQSQPTSAILATNVSVRLVIEFRSPF